ncbi:MAG: SCO family protein [Flammeovirgaceae bacterium]
MKNSKKAGILIAILVVPVLVFGFIKTFFVNEFIHLEKINPSIEGCEANLVDNFHQVPSFSGIDQQGNAFQSDQLKGKISVVNFITTREKNKQLSFSMARALERFNSEDDVILLSHTLDPQHDSSQVLANFAKDYRAQAGKWYFIQGAAETIESLTTCGYGVKITQENSQRSATTFVVVDKKGHIRGYYEGMDRKDINRMMDEIAILLLEYKKQNG